MVKPKDFEVDEFDSAIKAAVEPVIEPVVVHAKANHAILSDAEVAAAKKEARDAIEKERKAVATKTLIADEKLRLQREEGLVSGDPIKDEMVNMTVDLPGFAGSVNVNMEPFWHGHTYTVPRHVANSIKEQMQRAWNHQQEIDGKSLAQNLLQRRDTKLTPVGVTNAPQAMA